MVPKKEQIIADVNKLIHSQQTDKVRARKNTITRAYKRVQMFFRVGTLGRCACCDRDDVPIVSFKHKLCRYCYNWCRTWLLTHYFKADWSKLPMAITEFREPIKCRFFETCGSILPRISPNGRITTKMNNLCPKCAEIYYSGVSQGRAQRIRAQLGQKRIEGANGLS